MSYDGGFDPEFDLVDDPAGYFAVPTDHPAFRSQQGGGDDDGEFIAASEYDGEHHAPGGDILQLPVGRYDGFGQRDDIEVESVIGTDDPRKRTAVEHFIRDRLDASRREHATRAIGQRNAIAHSRSVAEGEGSRDADGGEPSLIDALAASLEQAGINFRERIDGSPDNPVVEKVSLPLARSRALMTAPSFQECQVAGSLMSLKSNTAGDWIVSFRIDGESDDEVVKLRKAHGLSLDIAITRKSRDSE